MNVDATDLPGSTSYTFESFDNQMFKLRGFKIGFLNINSLSFNIDELRIIKSQKPLDILAVSETKSSSSISEEQINIKSYKVVRKD